MTQKKTKRLTGIQVLTKHFTSYKIRLSLQEKESNAVTQINRGDSIITSRPASRWVYTLFVILRDGKLGRWVVLD